MALTSQHSPARIEQHGLDTPIQSFKCYGLDVKSNTRTFRFRGVDAKIDSGTIRNMAIVSCYEAGVLRGRLRRRGARQGEFAPGLKLR